MLDKTLITLTLTDGSVERAKFTVDVHPDGTHSSVSYIAGELRDQEEYETYDGALVGMYEMALAEALNWTNLKSNTEVHNGL